MIFGLLRKINTAQPVRQGGLWDVYIAMFSRVVIAQLLILIFM